ncbi:MAG TPA: hypothetical protein PK659_07445 [Methanothrix sp.]|nr:hypothetical protein [Methanothrix sp.]HOL44066.1 hypothetical protein [Methanothrix sp.]
MVLYGNPSAWVGLTVELRAIGPVPVIVGTGILLLVGRSTRGPSTDVVIMNNRNDAYTYFHSGDLKEAIELAFGNGCPVVFAIRVLGQGATKASATLEDGYGNDCLELTASSEGSWGNSVTVKISDGDYNGNEFNPNLPGDGGRLPYYTLNCNLVQSSTNWVKVNGVARTIVYAAADLAEGKVYVDVDKGSLTFYEDEWPSSTDIISYRLKYHTKRVTVTDNERTVTFNNVPSLVHLIADLGTTGLVVAKTIAGETHLPENGIYQLSGGSNGEEIAVDDWETALAIGGERAAGLVGGPTCVAITDYEVEPGTYDLVPVLDAFLTDMANDFHPCLGFVTMAPNATIAEALELASGYNNRLLSIVVNGWDNSTVPKNIAIARAAKEAACALGESAAMAINAMNGLNGILNSFNQSETDVLTTGGLDVIIKKRGILPYIGISTATDWQFMRCVDNRTINFIIIAIEYICRQYYHRKRTRNVLSSIKQSIVQVLEDLKAAENIRCYEVHVSAHPTDTGRVNIDLTVENIGHIERFRTIMNVGIMGTGDTTTV